MGQPNPPGDIPLIEGLDSSWNDFVGAFPEDKRSELGSQLKERISGYESLKPWEDFSKNGYTPDTVQQAVDVFDIINRDPRQVYETIGKALGITPQQAKEAVEELEEDDDDGPQTNTEIEQLKRQVEILAQIQLAQRSQETAAQQAAAQDKELETELAAVRNKYGDFPEQEILMRMSHLNLSAEEAFKNYTEFTDSVRARRPAPTLLGGSGSIPNRRIDPTKLDGKDTRSLVAQMMEAANNQ